MLLKLLNVGLLLKRRDHLLLRGVHHGPASRPRHGELVHVVLRVRSTLRRDLWLLSPHRPQPHSLLLWHSHVPLCGCLWGWRLCAS